MKQFLPRSREIVACQTEANLRGSTGIGNAGIMNSIQAPHKDPRVAKTLPGVQVARVLIALLLLLPVVAAHGADAKPDAPDLVSGFRSPPQSAKPLVWWHWINGNVTKEGIEADLADMKRVGIAGAQMLDVSIYLPPGPVLRFGVAVRNAAGSAQPMVFAPVLGGVGSKMDAGTTFTFKVRLFAAWQSIPDSYASLARSHFKFQDYRHNALGWPNPAS